MHVPRQWKLAISRPQDANLKRPRPLNSQPPVRADFTPVDSREPHVSVEDGRRTSLSLSPIRGRPAPILCSGAKRGENLTRCPSPRDLARPGNADSPSCKEPAHGTTHPDKKAAVPSGNPSASSPHPDNRQQTGLLQEGNWSRSSARVCSQAKIRWYGYLAGAWEHYTTLYTARVCLAYSAWTPDFRSAFQVSPISSRLTCRWKGRVGSPRQIPKRLNRSRSSIRCELFGPGEPGSIPLV